MESAYYNHSDTFRTLYEGKTGALDPLAVVLATGHYFFRLGYPLSPANSYDLFHPGIYAGLLVLMLSFFVTVKKDKKNLIWWAAIFFPLVPVLRSPEMLSDTYLLLPAVFLFLMILQYVNVKEIAAALVLVFIGINFYESGLWTTREDYSVTRNFERRPGCNSAIRAAILEFQETARLRDSVRNYLGTHDCRDMGEMTFTKTLISLQLQTAVIYTDNISYDMKKELLEKLANLFYFPKLALASLAFKNNDRDFGMALMQEMGERHDQILWDNTYLEFVASNLEPNCNDELCRKVVSHFTRRPDLPFY